MPNFILDNTRLYFSAFSQKNIEILEGLYDEKINLFDWEQVVSSKKKVLEVNEELFNSFETIRVDIKDLHLSNHVIACEIDIKLDSEVKLKVVDIITWSKDGKILKVDAYKQ